MIQFNLDMTFFFYKDWIMNNSYVAVGQFKIIVNDFFNTITW